MPTLKRTLIKAIPTDDIPRLAKSGEERLSRKYPQSAELYNQILQSSRNNFANDELIEQVYKMLAAFGMDNQQAKLSDLPDFKQLIQEHATTIQLFAHLKLEVVKKTDDSFKETMSSLFCNLAGLTKTKLSLVTFAKAMHFLLPNLFMPIDHKYTLQFFYTDPPYKKKEYVRYYMIDTLDKQKQCFHQVFEQFRQFAQKHHALLTAQVDSCSLWNRNIAKVIDNIVIAYVSEKME